LKVRTWLGDGAGLAHGPGDLVAEEHVQQAVGVRVGDGLVLQLEVEVRGVGAGGVERVLRDDHVPVARGVHQRALVVELHSMQGSEAQDHSKSYGATGLCTLLQPCMD
jgi:hypothetical protein